MKILMFANTDWYLYNFRISLAKRIRELGNEVILVSPKGEFGRLLREEGFRWIPVRMERRSLNPFAEMAVLRELISVYRRESPDLVHHFTIKSVIYGSLVGRMVGVEPRVNAIAGMGFVFSSSGVLARTLRPIVRLLLKLVLQGRSSRLILQNPDDRDMVIRTGLINKDHIRLIRGSGVNTELFNVSKVKRPSETTRVLLASRLLWEKGIGQYAEASRILKNSGENIKFYLAGVPDEGNPSAIGKEEIEKWHKEGLVEPLGHVRKMEELLKDIDIVTLPTTYGEGVPRILLEAAASGLPIIATDMPGCREIVDHGVNGILIPDGDAAVLADAIRNLMNDPATMEKMGAAGRAKVLEQFDERLVNEKTLGVYRELLPIVQRHRGATRPEL